MRDLRPTRPEPLAEREAAGIEGGRRMLPPILICDPLTFLPHSVPTFPLPIPIMPAF